MTSRIDRRALFGAGAAILAGGLAASAQAARSTTILGICCSSRKGKTVSAALKVALDSAKAVDPGVEVELIELGGMKIDLSLPADQADDLTKVVEKMADPKVGAIIVASPVYMGAMSASCKLMFERMLLHRKNAFALRDKVGGALAVGGARNGGQELTLQSILMSFLSQDMIVVGDGKPTAHWGGTLVNTKDDISGDEIGLATAKGVGRRVAELALRLAAK